MSSCKFYILGLSLCLLAGNTVAQLILPPEPSINASGYILLDASTQEVLLERNSDERLPPASLTKIMTSYVAAAEVDRGTVSLTDPVPVSVKAWKAIGSRMFIDPNTHVPLIDLLRGVIVQSGNDASIAVAEHIAGSEEQFAEVMNSFGDSIGLTGSNFVNSTGLPNDNHYMTARDVATLSEALIRQYPEHYKLYAERDFEYNDIRQPNRNRMLALDSSVDGIKTGYTEAAGYCLAVSALRDDMRLISVVMGAASPAARVTETRKLLNYGFRNYQTKVLYEELQPIADVKVWYGTKEKVGLGVGTSLKKTMLRVLLTDVDHALTLPDSLDAPIKRGQQLGELVVTANQEIIATLPLVALEDVEEKGVFGRVWDSIQRMLEPTPPSTNIEKADGSSSS